VISIGTAAKLAGMPHGEFIDDLGVLKIPVVRYGQGGIATGVDGV